MPHALAAALFAAAMVALGAASAGIGSASAQSSTIGEVSSRATNPQPWLGDKPFITEKRHMGGNHWVVDVWSPANRAVISNNVLLPEGDKPRPSSYLLPGIEGGQAGMNWMTHTDIRHWAVGKNVNVVVPLGGAALDIAGHAPQRYKAAASYSGCPVRSGAIGFPTSTAMIAYGGGSSFTAWGLPGSPQWFEHDPNANPGRLRDVEVFVGSASGTPGPIDGTNSPAQWLGPRAVEMVADQCSEEFTRNARNAGVRMNRYFSPQGSHTFGLFSHQMKLSWDQTIARTIGA